jgi:hypothetical protein
MRRVGRNEAVELPHFHLYLDDLIDIENAFRATGMRDFAITADHFEFDHAEDLPKLGAQETSDLKYRGYEPYATLEIRGFQARIYVEDMDDLRLVGLVTKVQEIARRPGRKAQGRRRWVVSLTRSTAPPPPTWRERNRDVTVALIGAVGGAVAAGVVTLVLIVTGVLKT